MSKIENKKKEVQESLILNDKDYIEDLLIKLKSLVKNYSISLTEASNEDLYNKHKSSFLVLSDLQRKTFELMFKYGWYSFEEVENKKLKEKYNELNSELLCLE